MPLLEISVPSKTFLLGEYAVLKGSGAILLSSTPRFKLMATSDTQKALKAEGIHPESPAGKLLDSNRDFYQRYHMKFVDPYNGLGGFGASSAQFVMVYALKNIVSSQKINDFDMLETYEKFAWNGEGLPPSGVDLISQLHGKICFFSKKNKILNQYSWPFPDLGYCLIHTGTKLATHFHLRETLSFNEQALEKIVQEGLESLEKKSSRHFIESINQYASALHSQNLVAEHTKNILKKLSEHEAVLSSKGCGALGADVIFILYELDKQDAILSLMGELKLNVISYGNDVSNGLEFSGLQI